MFGLNNPQNKNLNDDKKMNLGEDDFKVEDLPVHTMKNDLKELQNPGSAKLVLSESSLPEPISPEKSGPFFQKEMPKTPEKTEISDIKNIPSKNEPVYFDESQEFPKEAKKKESSQEPSSEKTEIAPTEKTHSGIGKAVFIAIIIFIILIAAGGGYYFWMTRISVSEEQNIKITQTTDLNSDNDVPDNTTVPVDPIISSLSLENPNYLQLNLADSTSESIKETLNEYADKVSKTGEVGVFEFIITDEKNNPLTFNTFANKFGLGLSQNILANLNSNFSFYIYSYGDMKNRFGFIANSQDEVSLRSDLLKEEENLPQALAPLYFTFGTPASDSFAPTTYKIYSIRYLNLTTSEDASVDYSIYKKQLIFGTTKTTLFSILDKISAKNTGNSL